MVKLSTKKQIKSKNSTTDWFDRIWLQKSTIKQLYFLRKMIYLYLEITGLLSKIINKYLEKDKQYSFIELGCGASSFLPYLAKKYNNLKLFGLDKSKMGCILAIIKDNDGNSLTNIICGDILNSPIKAEKFDIVFSFGLIEHFDNPNDVLKKHVDLLKPGGLLICIVPNVCGLQGKIFSLKKWQPKNLPSKYLIGWIGGMKLISINDLKTWLADFDLSDIKVDFIGGIFPFLIMESYHLKPQPLSYKLFYFVYRYLLFLPTIIFNMSFLFRLNSLNYSPLIVSTGIKKH